MPAMTPEEYMERRVASLEAEVERLTEKLKTACRYRDEGCEKLEAENARIKAENENLGDQMKDALITWCTEKRQLKTQLTAMQKVVDEYGDLIYKINSNLGTDWVHKLARCLPDKDTTK